MKETNRKLENIGFNNGSHAEEYFYNSFSQNPIFVKEKFDYVSRNIKIKIGKLEDEYDIVLYNDKSIAITLCRKGVVKNYCKPKRV